MPPSSTPATAPNAPTAPHAPRAVLRSFPSVNVVVRIERAAGVINAAPKPWSARAPIRTPSLQASPEASDAAVNTTSPPMKRRRRPSRSATRPPSRRRPPKRSAYALTIHWRFRSENPRSFWMDGSATFTIAMSSTTMNWTPRSRASASHFLCAAAIMVSSFQSSSVDLRLYRSYLFFASLFL